MSLNRYSCRRDINEQEVVDAFKLAGCSVERIDTPMDLLVSINGTNILVEVKSSKNAKFTKRQEKFIASWQGAWCRVETVAQALDVVRELKGQDKHRIINSMEDTFNG